MFLTLYTDFPPSISYLKALKWGPVSLGMSLRVRKLTLNLLRQTVHKQYNSMKLNFSSLWLLVTMFMGVISCKNNLFYLWFIRSNISLHVALTWLLGRSVPLSIYEGPQNLLESIQSRSWHCFFQKGVLEGYHSVCEETPSNFWALGFESLSEWPLRERCGDEKYVSLGIL